MNIFVLHPDIKNMSDQSPEHPIIHNKPANNTNEGSEFLDDAIYMHEQPLTYSEENITAGSPENFL